MRVVRDDDVDRRQVYRQQCQSRALLIARNFHCMLVLSVYSSRFPYMSSLISGGYSDGASPLPIPNREVKPVRADGTASSGRVGSRRFFPEESGIPHNVECRISGFIYLFNSAHEGSLPVYAY